MPKIVTYAAQSSPVSRRLSLDSPFHRARSKFVFGSPVMHHSPKTSPFSRTPPAKASIKIKEEPNDVDRTCSFDRTSPVVRWIMREQRPWSCESPSHEDDALATSLPACDSSSISSNGSEKCYSTTYLEESAVTIDLDEEDSTSDGTCMDDDEPLLVPKIEPLSTDERNCTKELALVQGSFAKQLTTSMNGQSSCQVATWFDPAMVPALRRLAITLLGHMSSGIAPPMIISPQEMIQFKVHAPRYTDLTPVVASKTSPLIAEMVSRITRLPHSHVKLTLPSGEKLQIISQESWPRGDETKELHTDDCPEKLVEVTKTDKGTSTAEDKEQQTCSLCHMLKEELQKLNDDLRRQIRDAERQLDELRQKLLKDSSQKTVVPVNERLTQSERRKHLPPWNSSTPRDRKRTSNTSPLSFENSKIVKKSRQMNLPLSANRKVGKIKVSPNIIRGAQTVLKHKPLHETFEVAKVNLDQTVLKLNKMLELAEKEKTSLQEELMEVKSQLEGPQSLQHRAMENELIQLREKNKLLMESYHAEKVARKRFFSMLEDAKGKIRVYCRIRPLLPAEKNTSILDSVDDFTVALNGVRGRQEFQFDQVFTPKHTQEDVFAIAKDMVDLAFEGYNVCIFGYGQTGSGKTYTLLGDPYGKDPGIASRAFLKLFELVDENQSTQETVVHISAMELYNEKLLDLLHPHGVPEEKLEIRKESNGMVNVVGCTSKQVDKPSTLLAIFHEACARRHVASTKMNSRSSRSHLIVTLLVESTNKLSGTVWRGKLSLVDLAGSERQSKLDTVMAQLKEANSINKSLSALGDVIAALASEQPHVPYRNNKLTLLMQDSLGGNAKTLMFVNVSPAQYNLEETTSSLHYAARVKQIKNDPSRIMESKEIARLKSIISRLRKGENVNEP